MKLKFSSKKTAGETLAGQGSKFYWRRNDGGQFGLHKGEGLKGKIFSFGQVKHLQTYCKTWETILDYFQVSFKEKTKQAGQLTKNEGK